MLDPDVPTLPRNASPGPEQDLPTIPHSLAPISGTGGSEAGDLDESESAWAEVWRRRWLVAGAASVAFLSALAFGRLSTSKQSPLPPPTVSGVSTPSTLETAAGLAGASAQPTLLVAEPGPEVPTIEVPPTEVPPAKGRPAAGRASRAPTSPEGAPRKRFVPSRL